MKKLSVVLIAALVLSFSAFAATIHVPGGYPTIQAGIDAAVDGDTVLVADGTFTGIGNKNIDFTGKEIVVMSENGPETCIIDCEDDGRGFYFHSGEDTSSVISSMKIINGSISYGGGIFCAVASSPIIDNCIITENNTTWGGGIYCQSNSSPIISNCDISRNSANWNGGGMYFSASSATIINCTIIENSAYNGYGGGIYLDVSNPIIENCTLSGSVGNYGGGIRCNGSNPNIINTIVENNTSGGIYFDGSSNSSINYSDFYNNEDGNFIGSIPVGLGIIALINTNGDSCDQFYNIFMDPLFYSTTGDSAYYLIAESPCIDAGDPLSLLDPDGTIADIGAYYYDQSGIPPIFVSITPYNPPIIIPANGGTFNFNIAVENQGLLPVVVDIWTMATLPNGNEYGPIIGPVNLTLNPGYSGNRDRTQNVPASAPAGLYTYDAYIGNYPNDILDEDHFDFEKLSTDDGSGYIHDWNCWGEGFEGEAVESYIPSETALHSPHPNPFNPSTTIAFELKEAGEVSLIVYDVQGREVQSLVNGHRSLGYHEVVFDGTDLSSGMYFVSLQVGKFTQTQKMILLK